MFIQVNKEIYKINDYIHNNYVIMIKQLRNLNFHEVSKIFSFCIEKNKRDVNMKKILYQSACKLPSSDGNLQANWYNIFFTLTSIKFFSIQNTNILLTS